MDTARYFITTMEEMREATKWLKTLTVSNSTGFFRHLNIRVNVKTSRGKKVLIDFYFNNKKYYTLFKRFLRELEKIKV